MWAKVGDEWWSHPKVLGATNGACGLWIRALSWSCHQRRDIVPPSFVEMVGGTSDEVAELVDRGLWIVDGAGWRIHDWADYQEQTLSEKRAEAGAKGGRASKRKQTDVASEANGQAGPSRPVPDPSPVVVSECDRPSGPQAVDDGGQGGVKRAAWSTIARWKAEDAGKVEHSGWVKSTTRNQPNDPHPDGGTFDEQADRILSEHPSLSGLELAQALTGRLSKRTLAMRAS